MTNNLPNPAEDTSSKSSIRNFFFGLKRPNPDGVFHASKRRSSRARSPSPCPFTPCQRQEQMEKFPAYEENDEDWKEWKACNDDLPSVPWNVDHCTQHCKHNICISITLHNKNTSEPRVCRCHIDPPPTKHSINEENISRLSQEDITAAESAYDRTDKEGYITVGLRSATKLVENLRQIGHIDLCSYLRRHSDFTPNILYNRNHYRVATRSTNNLIDMLLLHLYLMLWTLHDHARSIEIRELEQTMHAAMRMELFWWLSKWYFKDRMKMAKDGCSEVEKLNKGFSHARWQCIQGLQSKGAAVLMQRAESVVRMVVSVLVWWSQRGVEGSGGDIVESERGQSPEQDSSVLSSDSAQSTETNRGSEEDKM